MIAAALLLAMAASPPPPAASAVLSTPVVGVAWSSVTDIVNLPSGKAMVAVGAGSTGWLWRLDANGATDASSGTVPFDIPSGSYEAALVSLRALAGDAVQLAGRSPVTGESERLTVLTRPLSDGHVLYALLVTPASGASRFAQAFDRMVDSLRVDDRSAHR